MNNQVTKPGLMDRFKNRKRPGKPWVLAVAAALIAASFIVVFMFYQMGSSPSIKGEARTRAMRNDVESTPGGNASQAYREKVEELNRKNAESAERDGRSYISSVEGQLFMEEPPEKDKQEDEQPRETKPEPYKNTSDEPSAQVRAMEKRMRQMQDRMEAMQRQQYQQNPRQSQHRTNRPERDYSRQYGKQLAQLTAELDQDFAGQQVVVFEEASYIAESGIDTQAGSKKQPGSGSIGQDSQDGQEGQDGQAGEEKESGPEVTAGDVLYARNEILLNSDAPGPAQATVLAGDFQGATLLGGFDKTGDYLSVKFSRMVLPNGDDYKVEGVAIDPEVSATAVRSDVNRHILSRWGGLMGASFLAGFGDAVKTSGSDVVVSDGTTVSSQPDLDTEQELWAAAGRVGQELSAVMKKNFNRPSTVKLAPGTNIGILFLSAEKKNN